jgi:antitoxin ParD1/3/4
MSTMNISLPEELRSFVDSQVSGGDYTSSSEYVRELLRKEKDRVRLRRLLLDGMESELIDEPMDSRYFDNLRKRISEKQK